MNKIYPHLTRWIKNNLLQQFKGSPLLQEYGGPGNHAYGISYLHNHLISSFKEKDLKEHVTL